MPIVASAGFEVKAEKAKVNTTQKKESIAEYPEFIKKDLGILNRAGSESFELEGHTVKVVSGYISAQGLKGLAVHTLGFQVDEAYDVSAGIDSRAGRKIAFGIRDRLKLEYAKLEDGTIVNNAPHQEDGKGASRARLYKQFGFGEVDKKGEQWGVMQGGKVLPISRQELNKLVKQRKGK